MSHPSAPGELVRGLTLTDTEISDAGLQHLSKLKKLGLLVAENTKITGTGLKHLARHRDLDGSSCTGWVHEPRSEVEEAVIPSELECSFDRSIATKGGAVTMTLLFRACIAIRSSLVVAKNKRGSSGGITESPDFTAAATSGRRALREASEIANIHAHRQRISAKIIDADTGAFVRFPPAGTRPPPPI